MIKENSYNLLKLIIESEERDIDRLCILYNINKKQFWYELSVLNDDLKVLGERVISCDEGKLLVDKALTKRLNNLIYSREISLFESPEDRVYFLYIYIACSNEFLSTVHFTEFLSLSRNAVMLDLKRLREWASNDGVEVLYTRTKGYHLVGEEKSIRKLIEKSIFSLQNKYSVGEIFDLYKGFVEERFNIYKIYSQISDFITTKNIKTIYDRMEEFIYLIPYIKLRIDKGTPRFDVYEKKILKMHPIYDLSLELTGLLYGQVSDEEVFFLESRILGIIQGNSFLPDVNYFRELVNNIIYQMQALIQLDNYDIRELKDTLYQHLVPAYYRLKFDLYYYNPLLDKIKRDYEELFELTRIALQPLVKAVNKSISESEIAYFTIHFGGYLKRKNLNKDYKKLKALTVCPNGISSSLIMATTLRETFPEIEIINTHNIDDIKYLNEDTYDFIFSTTYFPSSKKLYLTSPILNGIERDIIREKVSNDFKQIKKPQIINTNDLVTIIEKHVNINNKQNLINDINSYIYNRSSVFKREMKGLTELLKVNNIRITDKHLTWREAIKEASKPLLEDSYIEHEYIDAMIETVENIGPYIVLAPKVAVPHARPERGVNKLGISLLKLDNEVDFNTGGEEDSDRYVSLIFVLAAIDGEAHLKALMQLSKILDEEEHIDQLIELNNVEEIYNKINMFITEGGE